MSRLRTLRDLDFIRKRVLLRVDYNVPIESGSIVDDARIRASLPTVRALLDGGAAIMVATHLGRPEGIVVDDLRVAPLASRLGELLALDVAVAPGVAGDDVIALARELPEGSLMMLENVRFDPGEESNDPAFARRLADMAEVYVDDAFGAAHRAHASTEGVAHLLPGAAGLLLEREVRFLTGVIDNPKRPLLAIIGGAKISTKIGVLRSLLTKVDRVLVGGAMACTLLKAGGAEVGDSKIEVDQLGVAQELLRDAGDKLVLPLDAVAADRFAEDAATRVTDARAIPAGWMMLDVGPKTVERYGDEIANAATVVWNGPLGVYELEPFGAGTEELARRLADSDAISVIGGGDLGAAIARLGIEDKFTHVSTGGGATLELLEGKELPGVKVLEVAE